MDKKELGARLKKMRRAAGFTSAKQFAEEAGLSLGSYSSYENGTAMPPFDKATMIVDTLNKGSNTSFKASLDDLAGRETTQCERAGGILTKDEAALLLAYRVLNEDGRTALRSEAARLFAGMLDVNE